MALLTITFIIIITLGYFTYGGIIGRIFKLNPHAQTPAHSMRDDHDYTPTHPFYLFAQHFSAIAAAGPIAGPILACQKFGWLPALLWIGIGVVFIGAVHDFATLTCSVRHQASSIADIGRKLLGQSAGKLMSLFILLALIYIIVAFSDITAASFVTAPEELSQVSVNFHPGGAVAWAAVAYLLLSILLGLCQRYLKTPLWLNTLIFVPASFGVCWMGTYFSHWFAFSHQSWCILIVVYCALAALLPMWILMQPRGYLGGHILYSVILIGLIGLIFGGHSIQAPSFKGFFTEDLTGSLFPFLFVSIACGACSGFHGLVCSGTTSKQIDKEHHTHAIGYGAMLAEAVVALIALGIIMILPQSQIAHLRPGTIYGQGIGMFLAQIIGEEYLPFTITFGAMAFSTFVFDTLDVSTRLGRYLVVELLNLKNKLGDLLGVTIILLPALLLLVFSPQGMWQQFWLLFGAANQLLAALSLLIISVWLNQRGQKLYYTFLPMIFVLVITSTSLIQLIRFYWQTSQGVDIQLFNALLSLVMLLLAFFLVMMGIRKIKVRNPY